MLENQTDNNRTNRLNPETAGGQTGEDEAFLRIRRLQLNKKRAGMLLGVDMGLDIPKEPPPFIRLPIRAAWRAIRSVVRALGLELVADREE